MHLDEGLEVADALMAHLIHEALDDTEVLHPQRHRGMLEQTARIALAALQLAGRLDLGRDVFQRHQHAAPGVFMPRQYAATNAHIQPAAVQSVVHGLVGKLQHPRPQQFQLVHDLFMHVIAEHLSQVAQKLFLAVRCKQLQRALIDAQHPQAGGALAQPVRVCREMLPQICHALRAPDIEQLAQRAVVLQPERHRRQRKHVFEIGARRIR